MINKRAQHGFTLIEVMVALIIFAVCALVLLQQSGRSAQQALLLETRTLASWIAENELTRLRLADTFPANGDDEQELRFGGRDWVVISAVENTSNADLKRAKVQVFRAEERDKRLFELIGFVGRH